MTFYPDFAFCVRRGVKMKKILLLSALLASAVVYIGCSGGGDDSGSNWTLLTPSMDYQLGAVYDPGTGTADFRFWSPSSGAVSLVLYGTHAGTIPMEKDLITGGDETDAENWNACGCLMISPSRMARLINT